jgi:transmembrane sensor
MHSSEQVEQRAAEWLAKQDNHELTAAEQGELTRWLDESPAHRVAYIRLAEAWRRLAQLGAQRA